MIEFWIYAGLLCAVALGFLLYPLVRERKRDDDGDRAELNVRLYQERLQELAALHDAVAPGDPGLQAARDEAARSLLADTDIDTGTLGKRRLGGIVPGAAAVLVPVVALLLYAHFGAIEDVQRTAVLAEQTLAEPRTPEPLIARLEHAVQTNPASAEGWYFLGRMYLSQGRAADAANALGQAIELSERAPHLLGLWAQSLYFAGNKQWTPQLDELTDEALKADPNEVSSLGLLGVAAYEANRYDDAVGYWQRLMAAMPEGDPSRQPVIDSITQARRKIASSAENVTPSERGTQIRVRVELSDTVQGKVQPSDSVFVFARAVSGPPMPLAVKRMRVDDLPADVTLTDSDAMMQGLTLSGAEQVELVARVSQSGDAQHGEWVGRESPTQRDTNAVRRIIIDSVDGIKK